MKSLSVENLSPFGRLAVKLDVDFSELDRLSGQIQKLELQSDTELDRAVKLLNLFAQHGQNITTGIQEFSSALQAAREQSEVAAKAVTERALLVQQRKQTQEQMNEKLNQLGQKVRSVSERLAEFRKPAGTVLSNEEKLKISTELKALDSELVAFIEEAEVIKAEASAANLNGIEQSAQALNKTLQSARRKLSTVV